MYTQITMSKNSIKQLEQLVEEMKKDDTQQLKKNLIQNRSENIQLKKELHYLESKIYTVLNELEVVKDKDLVPARMLELLKAHMEMKEKETVEQKVQYKQLQKKFEDIFVQNIQKQNNHSQQHLVNDKFQIYKRDFSNHQKSTKSSKNLQQMRSVSPIQKKKSGERIKKSEDDESRLDQMIIDQSSQYPVLSDLVKKAKGEFQFKNYFQKKKVIMKIENDHIVIRIGGGYVTLEQFAKLYHTREVLANIQI